jgi:hypothetical protein
MNMTWEEKFAAIIALTSDASLKMRAPGDWYVSYPGVSRKEDSILTSGLERGFGPGEAVNQAWTFLTDNKYYLVISRAGKRRAVKWNGFMWIDVDEG